MILLELAPPFQWRPSTEEIGAGWRFMWGWLAIAYVPYEFNEYIEEIAQAGVSLYLTKIGEMKCSLSS
jgi:hypothetical protein